MAELKVMHLVRHGEVMSPSCLLGSTNVGLTELGRIKLVDAVERLVGPKTRIFSSPLNRCSLVANQVADNKTLKCDLVDELKEYDFGCLDGVPFSKYSNTEEVMLASFWRDPVRGRIPDAEMMPDFQKRIHQCLMGIWDEIDGEGVVVTHGGVVRMVLNEVLNLGLDAYRSLLSLEIPYGSITTIERFQQHDQSSYRVKRVGWTHEFN
ncbi:histidine phosphatase family protein [Corallincola platygyrae]|uniref:Histidine phosphatase family protein n=1 Tax=Corallincola platygyrae TaxID=1193278 RepID=A0ABW4XKH1_9GAMM